jgi:hypothetical protein
MTTLQQLTEESLSAYVSDQALARGRVLYQAGAVPERYLLDDDELDAGVREGNRYFNPHAYFDGNALVVGCECRAGGRTVCAHTVAMLLAWIHEPESFKPDDEPDVSDLIDLALDDEPDLGLTVSNAPTSHATSAQTIDPKQELIQLLANLPLPQLRELAKRHQLAISGNARDAFLAPLAQILAQRETVEKIWASLSRPAQKLLGALPLMRMNNLVFPQQAKQAFQMIDSKAAANFDALITELVSAGLIFRPQQQFYSLSSLLAMQLPPDIDFGPSPDDAARLKPQAMTPITLDFVSLVTRVALVINADPDRFVARPWPGSPQSIEQQIFGLAGWPHYPAELEALKYDKQTMNQVHARSFGVPPAPSPVLAELRDELVTTVGAPPDQLDFALRLLIALGIVKAAPDQPLTVIEKAFHAWLAEPPLTRALMVFNAFAYLNSWTELDRLSDLHHPAPHLRHTGNVGYGLTYNTMLNSMAVARGYLLLMLRRVPPDRWIDLEAFVARARAFHLNPNVWPLQHGVYLDLNGRQPNMANALDWQAAYGAFVEAVLTGPLVWQGAIEVAVRLDRVAAFRLTALGARLFGQNLNFVPPENKAQRDRAAMKFLPDGDLALPIEATSTDLLGLLSRVCTLRSDPAGARLIYRLSPAGVSRVFEAGGDDVALISTLQKLIDQPLLRAWQESITQWWSNFGTLHLYADVAVIELADDFALTELLAGTSLTKHLLYRFSPRLIAVRAEGVDELRDELIKKGYTPKTVNND